MSVLVEVSPAVLEVEVIGMDRVWGFRRRIEVPMSRLVDVTVVPRAEAKSDVWLRTGGLGFPGVAAVGNFRGRIAKRQWWRVYRAERVVVIDLAPGGRFDRIVLEVDDPDALAARINESRGEAV